MGKIRVTALGEGSQEKEQKRRAQARRETKKAKKPLEQTGKQRVGGVGMKGGERVAVVEGTEIRPEYKKLIEEVESRANQSSQSNQGALTSKKKIHSKRYQNLATLVDKTKFYPLPEAVQLVKKTSTTKFDGTVELHINLNRVSLGDKPEYRGSVSLPHGTGKQVKVVIADDAILADVTAGKINFDILVATPDMMPKLAKVARILGPKGLMPNPKNGTVTENPEKRVKELSQGQVNFKTEPEQPIIHLSIGKVSFPEEHLAANIETALHTIGRNKIIKATISSTMGPGIKLVIN